MIRNTTHKKALLIVVPVLIVLVLTAWWLHSMRSQHHQLSVKPAYSTSAVTLEPRQSNIGLHAKLPYRVLIRAAEQATDNPQTGDGEKQSCKKVLGAKVCATLVWEYAIQRDGEVRIEAQGERVQIKLPISFEGLVSVDGRGGKLLGLRRKKINGKLELTADLDINIKDNWCPVLDSDISYQWLSDPQIELVGKIKINLRKSVDKALQSKLTDLQSTLAQTINCEELRHKIQQQWRTHTVNFQIDANTESQLSITPLGASVSKIGVGADHVAMSFDLGATVHLKQQRLDSAERPPDKPDSADTNFNILPDLTPYTGTPGTVEFSLLVDIPYSQLQSRIATRLLGRTFGRSASNSLTVSSIDLYPAGELLIVDVGFVANVLGSMIETRGNVYISTKPVARPASNELFLEDLQLTRTIDSKLMSALTIVLRQQLLNALQSAATVDLGPSLAKVETSIQKVLSNPLKTGGVLIDAHAPEVRLMALNPQAEGIAAIIHLSTRLNATIPEDVLIR